MYNIIYKGPIFTVSQIEHNNRKYDVVEHAPVVFVLAAVGDELLFVEQTRPILGKRVLEIPAGFIEENESPELAAIRELEEETGYRADDVVVLASYYTSYGFSTEKAYVCLATGLTKTATKFDETEDIVVKKINIDEAISRWKEFESGGTMNALLILSDYLNAIHRDKLKKAMGKLNVELSAVFEDYKKRLDLESLDEQS